MIDVSLRTLRYFVAAADHGNVTLAAQTLKVSQPSVSIAIARVEKLFNAQLFVRQHSKGMALTPAGTEVLREARKLLRTQTISPQEALAMAARSAAPSPSAA